VQALKTCWRKGKVRGTCERHEEGCNPPIRNRATRDRRSTGRDKKSCRKKKKRKIKSLIEEREGRRNRNRKGLKDPGESGVA